MWRFYWRSVKRIPSLAVQAVKSVDTAYGFLAIIVWLVIGGAAAGAWLQHLSWKVPAYTFIAFFGYGLLRAVYQEYLAVEVERNELKKAQETPEKRKALRNLLGDALEEGLSLRQGKMYDLEAENPEKEEGELLDEYHARYEGEIRDWVDGTYDLIHAAFGKAEAQRFISNEGLDEEELFGRGLPRFLRRTPTQRKYSILARLKRLEEVIDRTNTLGMNPDFDPAEWTNP